MAIGNSAHLLYGQGQAPGLPMEAIPRNKFSFTVSLNTIDGTVDLRRIANIQMPSFVYRTQTLNNYNNKSIVQTGIDYTPISLTAYDTKDPIFEEFLKKYAAHYFAGPMNETDYKSWLANPHNKGLQLRSNKNYISSMTITRIDTGPAAGENKGNIIEIFHPFITNADADTLDYSDSGPSTFRVSFSYEGYRILSDITADIAEGMRQIEDTANIAVGTDDTSDKVGQYLTDINDTITESSHEVLENYTGGDRRLEEWDEFVNTVEKQDLDAARLVKLNGQDFIATPGKITPAKPS